MVTVLALPTVAHAQDTLATVVTGSYPRIADVAAVRAYTDVTPRPDTTVVDSRSSGFDAGHIPGAINIPVGEFEALAGMLPFDRKQPLIFYCENAACPESHASAFMAEKHGYVNVSVYAGGFSHWLAGGGMVAVSAAYIEKLRHDHLVHMLIDARPKRTATKGMIPGAVNIPDIEFDKHLEQLPADKGSLLIYYCGGLDCPLSSRSAAKARKLGYRNVRIYPEGYPGWMLHERAGSVVVPTQNH